MRIVNNFEVVMCSMNMFVAPLIDIYFVPSTRTKSEARRWRVRGMSTRKMRWLVGCLFMNMISSDWAFKVTFFISNL